MLKALGLIPSLGFGRAYCNLSPAKVEKRKFQGHFRIHRVLEAGLGYIKLQNKPKKLYHDKIALQYQG